MASRLIIAIPSYKRPEALGTLLSQLEAQEGTKLFSVFVLNDGSDPDSTALLSAVRPARFALRTRATATGSGLPRARNIMLDWIDAEEGFGTPTVVAFLDDDCEVNTKFVQEILHATEQYEAFCFRITTIGQSGIINTMHNPIARIVLKPFIGAMTLPLGFIRGGYFQELSRPRRVRHLPGGCLIYRFDRYAKLRFDEMLGGGHAVLEDTDFSCALRAAGAKLWYIGSYGIVHRPAQAGGVRLSVPKEKYYFYWKHKRFLIGKWSGKFAYITAIPFTFFESIGLSVISRAWLVGLLYYAL